MKTVPKRKHRYSAKASGPKREGTTSRLQQQEWSVEISKENITGYPIIEWNGPIKLLSTLKEMKKAVDEILSSGERHLGFDTETKANFTKGRPQQDGSNPAWNDHYSLSIPH
jgi:hypothetical protein